MYSEKMPTRFNSILEKSQDGIAALLRHIKLLRHLDNELTSCLGLPASKHCCVANITDDMLILHTDSSAWASKLRYLTPSILDHMRNMCDLPSIKSVRIRVQPRQTESESYNSKQNFISLQSATFLKQAAESTSDQQIRSCYLKLAKNNRP